MKMKYSTMHFGTKKNKIRIVHLNKPIKNGVAGLIVSPLFPEPVGFFADDAARSDLDYALGCLAGGESGKAACVRLERDVFYDFKRGRPYARMILFHELGHHYHKDLVGLDAESYDATRFKTAETGKVMEMELKADAFAASYLGRAVALAGLEEIKTLILQTRGDRTDIRMAVFELDERIRFLQSSEY